jgi:hypothetical protein
MAERELKSVSLATPWRVARSFGRHLAGKRARSSRHHIESVRPELVALAQEIVQSKLTYLPRPALIDLASVTVRADEQGVPGAIVEAGVALGGSATILASAKSTERPLLLCDVFGVIPAPGPEDGEDVHARYRSIVSGESVGIGGDTYYGYRGDLLTEVRRNLTRFGIDLDRQHVHLISGLFEHTMPGIREPIAVAHLDSDWYESTKIALRCLSPLVSRGGRFVVDDYQAWSGCRKAVDEFLASPMGRGFRCERRTRLHLVRTKPSARRLIRRQERG